VEVSRNEEEAEREKLTGSWGGCDLIDDGFCLFNVQ